MKAASAAAAADDFAAARAHSSPPDPGLFIKHARALHAARRDDEAIRTLDDGLAKLGPLITPTQEAIDLEDTAGRIESALVRVEKMIESAPRKERWLVRRATLLEKLARPRKARESLIAARSAIEALPAERRASAAMAELSAQIDGALTRLGAR